MVAPTNPTVVSLVTEGLRQARIFSPTASQVSIYQTEVMEQLKNTLWTELKQAKPLQTFAYTVLIPGQSRYSCPTDYSSDMSMSVLTGLVTGQVVSGVANQITISGSVGSVSQDMTLGKDVMIIAGTAFASCSQIVGVVFNADTTITLTVYPNFQSTPDSTSTFMIVDNSYPVTQDHIANYDKFRPSYLGRPTKFYPVGDEDYDEFIFDCAPDSTYFYGLRMRYFVNVMTLDLSSPLMNTLYLKFRDYWIAGIKAQALADNDDTDKTLAANEARGKLQELIMSQQYGTDIHTLRQHVEDY